VEETLRQSGYAFLLGTSGLDRALEVEQIERILAQGASGLIVYVVDGPMACRCFGAC
jgi:DNA-binding LacI/PurR family transcriptional regulator